MKRKLMLAGLCLAAALQIAWCAFLVARAEDDLRRGQAFSLRIGGYDPMDPFRGRYIVFSLTDFDQGRVEDWYKPRFGRKEMPANASFFVRLGKDAGGGGWAEIIDLALEPGKKGSWLRMETDAEGMIQPVLDRFYLPEDRADELDKAFAAARDRRVDVRIREGRAVITALVLDGARIPATAEK